MVQRTGKKFGSANKAVVVMVPRGGSPNHTADVGSNNMKRRFSVEKAEWSTERDEQYKADAQILARKLGLTITVRNGTVYANDGRLETELCTPSKPQTFWYETWLKIRSTTDHER
jgi:hypothetical protein